MTRPAPTEACQEIAGIIGESLSQAADLNAALDVERRALERQDTDALEEIVAIKNEHATKLQALDRQRSRLCEEWGFAAGSEQMAGLIEWCDEHGIVEKGWTGLLQLAADGNTLNLTNGAIIRLRQQQFETSISVLRGVAPGSDTYGRNGAESGDANRRSLAEA